MVTPREHEKDVAYNILEGGISMTHWSSLGKAVFIALADKV